MKLFGSSNRGNGNKEDQTSRIPETWRDAVPESEEEAERKARRRKRTKRLFVWLLVLVLLAAIGCAAYYFLYVRPPEIVRERLSFLYEEAAEDAGVSPTPDMVASIEMTPTPEPTPTPTPVPTATPAPTPVLTPAPSAVYDVPESALAYTFAVLGIDQDGDSADAVMICYFDIVRQHLDVMSLPADTLVNTGKDPRHLSTLYGEGGSEAVVTALSHITGYTLDFSITVKMDAFAMLIDEIGGVEYNIPQSVDYTDPAKNVTIKLTSGMQKLDGATAVQLMRYEELENGGIEARIQNQHGFLFAAARQILENRDEISLSRLARLIVQNCETDLSYGNIIWFTLQACSMPELAMNFYTIPGTYYDAVPGVREGSGRAFSIHAESWLMYLNEYFNPYIAPFTLEELSILRYDPIEGEVTSTNGVIVAELEPVYVEGEPVYTDPHEPLPPNTKRDPEPSRPEKP
ncbi:MAG: LCP family protein [Oscillospiraceae bacterium]|nr:LCP family protein [Oscillospiraceae bacterium]